MDNICVQVNCFNLKYTLECGQCFRWEKFEKGYIGIVKDRVIYIYQEENKIYISSSNMNNIKDFIIEYFDLNVDYMKIEEEISKIDKHVKEAVINSSGIRILNQDFFETLISFIISANNNIPRISRSITDISKKYGKAVMFMNKEYYLFPEPCMLAKVVEEDFRKCGVGFRAKYLKDTVSKILNKEFDIEGIKSLQVKEAKDKLMNLQGVGPKVSDCILLFSLNKKSVFPIDVWIERVMTLLYFKETKKNLNKNDILEYAKNNFKENSGIVQQHLFYNIREKLL